jgi:hypothetical protein
MEILQALGTQGGMAVGLVSVVAEILVAYWFLRSFKIIKRREYVRLKGTEAEHQRCQAEWDRMCALDNWAKDIRIAARGFANKVEVEPEFDAPEPIRNRR